MCIGVFLHVCACSCTAGPVEHNEFYSLLSLIIDIQFDFHFGFL